MDWPSDVGVCCLPGLGLCCALVPFFRVFLLQCEQWAGCWCRWRRQKPAVFSLLGSLLLAWLSRCCALVPCSSFLLQCGQLASWQWCCLGRLSFAVLFLLWWLACLLACLLLGCLACAALVEGRGILVVLFSPQRGQELLGIGKSRADLLLPGFSPQRGQELVGVGESRADLLLPGFYLSSENGFVVPWWASLPV